MEISVANEVYIFFAMIVVGGIWGVIFDFFRVIRKVKKMNTAFVAVSDFLFLICTGILFIGALLKLNDGALRWFEFIGVFLGGLMYFLLISWLVMKLFIKIIEIITTIISYILKILLTPLFFLYKILSKPIKFIFHSSKNRICISFRTIKMLFSKKKRRE